MNPIRAYRNWRMYNETVRELNKLNRLPGYAGSPSRAATEAINKFVLVDMFANAATGKMKPEEAVAWAENEYKQAVAKG